MDTHQLSLDLWSVRLGKQIRLSWRLFSCYIHIVQSFLSKDHLSIQPSFSLWKLHQLHRRVNVV